MKRALMAVLALMAISASACGGKPCEKLLKYYCEEKKNEQLCASFTDRVNSGMSKEACESSLSAAR
ncbi:MAG: hypothetical protein GXP54_04340 [Deltaproteobacteria bacterium]|nr:hypothetical protein [Deltaproteobacteria bacterium]